MGKAFWLLIILLLFFRFLTSEVLHKTFQDGQKIRITERISGEPTRTGLYQSFRLENLWIKLPMYPEIIYGDVLTVEGTVKGDGLTDVQLVQIRPSTNPLLSVRARILALYKQVLPEPHASLVAGVVLGAKSSLPYNFNQALKKTGTSHVVVASGMNVSLVAGFLLAALVLVMPRRKAVFYALIGVLLYAFLAGFDAPIIRASIMGSIAFVGQGLGRLTYAWRVFFTTAVAMLLIRPEWIVDVGFVLSFAATASLMLLGKRIEKRLSRVPAPFRESLSTSLAAQVGVAPILFVTFGQFNILSPVINALVLWTIPFITIIGGVAALGSFIFEPMARLILYFAYPFTAYFVAVVEFFAKIG